ncbi:Clp protease N-terminal domain-containing protein [Leifsonia poae]|uniref:Clp protease N-terminal domain-containing protein n=1 Tax=Leifsonia poae TaxID=110933 RepID=UPI0022F290BC|nr:Clp protease N-terminal domain-containing protein [Leifsonia poae]
MAENTRTGGIEGRDDPRLSRALRGVVIEAVAEAQRRGAPTVEAEHLLLALSLEVAGPAAHALAAAGLDHTGIERALRAEREAGLAAAGVAPIPDERLRAAPRLQRPRWGASAREALVSAHRLSARTRRPGPGGRAGHGAGLGSGTADVDLLKALLAIELGTVPRALALAGIDRQAILSAAA